MTRKDVAFAVVDILTDFCINVVTVNLMRVNDVKR